MAIVDQAFCGPITLVTMQPCLFSRRDREGQGLKETHDAPKPRPDNARPPTAAPNASRAAGAEGTQARTHRGDNAWPQATTTTSAQRALTKRTPLKMRGMLTAPARPRGDRASLREWAAQWRIPPGEDERIGNKPTRALVQLEPSRDCGIPQGSLGSTP